MKEQKIFSSTKGSHLSLTMSPHFFSLSFIICFFFCVFSTLFHIYIYFLRFLEEIKITSERTWKRRVRKENFTKLQKSTPLWKIKKKSSEQGHFLLILSCPLFWTLHEESFFFKVFLTKKTEWLRSFFFNFVFCLTRSLPPAETLLYKTEPGVLSFASLPLRQWNREDILESFHSRVCSAKTSLF